MSDNNINVTAPLHAATKKGKLAAAKEVFLEGDTQTVEKEIQDINSRHNDLKSKHESLSSTVSDHAKQIGNNQSQITANKSAQDEKNTSLDANMAKLNTRDDQITELIKGVTATGGASVATAVTYDNTSSQLVSATVQGAVDELQDSKISKTSISQESGESEDKVMSQKAVSTKLIDLSNFSNGVSLINPQDSVPNFDVTNKVLDLGKDPVLIVGSHSYSLSAIWASDTSKYRAIKYYDETSQSGAIRIVFNTNTKEFRAVAYSTAITNSDIVIAALRLNYQTKEFISGNAIFDFTVNGGDKFLQAVFEFGSVNLDKNPWEYSESKTRIISKKEYPIRLRKGDIVGLTDYSDARFYVGWKNEKGVLHKITSWATSDYTITENGDYQIVICNVEEKELEDVSSLSSLFFCKQKESSSLYSVNNDIRSIKEELSSVQSSISFTNGLSLINPQDSVPNFDVTNKVLDLGKDPVLIVGSHSYSLSAIWASDTSKYRAIKYYDETSQSGAIRIVFNTNTKEFRAVAYSTAITNSDIVVAALRLNYQTKEFISGNAIFDFTVGKVVPSNMVNSFHHLYCNTRIKIICHRGVHLNGIPENSLDAYRIAGYCGYDYVETDFCPTKDDELVLMHDSTINRTMKNKSDYSDIVEDVEVVSKTLSELRENYVLASDDVRMRKPIPTLEEFFVTCRESAVFPIAEIKTSGATKEHVKKAFDLGCKTLGVENFGFCSFSYELLDYARSLSDDILLLYLGNSTLGTTNTVTSKSRETKNTVWYADINGRFTQKVTKEDIEEYKKRGLKIATWLINPIEFNNAMKRGDEIIATDYVAPNLSKFKGMTYKSERDFSEFITDGTIKEGILILEEGQILKANASAMTKLWLGGYFLSVVGKGNFLITADNLNITIDSVESDRYIFQGMIDNQIPYLTIKAIGKTEIQFIEYSYVRF